MHPVGPVDEEVVMHAVMIRFTSSVPPTDLLQPFRDYAEALRDVRGLTAKPWILDGADLGGFHVFVDQQAAEAYLDGPLFGSVRDNPAFSGFRVEHFAVLDELSATTNGVGTGSAHLAER